MLAEEAARRRSSEWSRLLATVVRGFHSKDPAKLLRSLERAEKGMQFTRTGTGRQPQGGGVRMGDLMKILGKPKVQFVPEGAMKRGH